MYQLSALLDELGMRIGIELDSPIEQEDFGHHYMKQTAQFPGGMLSIRIDEKSAACGRVTTNVLFTPLVTNPESEVTSPILLPSIPEHRFYALEEMQLLQPFYPARITTKGHGTRRHFVLKQHFACRRTDEPTPHLLAGQIRETMHFISMNLYELQSLVSPGVIPTEIETITSDRSASS